MTLAVVMCTVGLASLYVHYQAPLFAVDATVPYGPHRPTATTWPNPNNLSRSKPMPNPLAETVLDIAKTVTGELGDITTTNEHPTLNGNGHQPPPVDVYVNYTRAGQTDGDRCILVGELELTAAQALALAKDLETAARNIADLRQLKGDQS